MAPRYHLCPMYEYTWSPGYRVWRLCGYPGTAYGAYVVARVPRMGLMWSSGSRIWRICGQSGTTCGTDMVHIWHVHGRHLAHTWCVDATDEMHMANAWYIHGAAIRMGTAFTRPPAHFPVQTT